MVTEINVLPAVCKMLRDTENSISSLIGHKVKLEMNISEKELTETYLQVLVTTKCKVSWAEMIGRSRKQHIVLARQIYSYYAYHHLCQTSPYIGQALKRDHSTILHYLSMVSQYMRVQDEMFQKKFNEIEKELS